MGQFQKPPYREGGMLSSIPPAVLLPEGVVLAGALTPSCTMRPKATPRGWQIGEPG